MKFSLINVYSENNGYISGNRIQDFTGCIFEAIKLVKDTEKANSNRIKVALIEEHPSTALHIEVHNVKKIV